MLQLDEYSKEDLIQMIIELELVLKDTEQWAKDMSEGAYNSGLMQGYDEGYIVAGAENYNG